MKPRADSSDPEAVRDVVRRAYGNIAATGGTCCGGSRAAGCGSAAPAPEELAKHIGYSAQEIAALPDGANLGLSCGNPNALAALNPGEVVLDLGSGAGFDVFIAGRAVGASGRAIGVDMTAEMVARARRNIAQYRERSGLDNVEFRLGEIEHLPIADHSVDAVISNCVINLSADKPQVWREIARVLKPAGRVAVSDLALLQPLPPEIATMIEALVGCIAGAVMVSDTARMAREAGLTEIRLGTRPGYLDGLVEWQDPLFQAVLAKLPAGAKASDYVTSLELTARKPATHAASSAPLIASEPMTTYVYETIPQSADEKSEYFEVKQSMTEPALTRHPQTGKPVRRVVLGGYGVLKSGAAAPAKEAGGCGCGPSGCCG